MFLHARRLAFDHPASGARITLEAPLPALVMGTQVLGEPRYPSLRGIMAARSKEVITRSLADLGIDAARVGSAAATTRVLGAAPPPPRAGAGGRPLAVRTAAVAARNRGMKSGASCMCS